MIYPPGNYTFEVVDSCGFTFTISFEVTALYPAVSIAPQDLTGCGTNGTGSVKISINLGATLQSVQMIAAPAGYSLSLPYDCSGFIALPSATVATIPNLPLGTYTFLVTDSCGITYTKTVTLAIFLNTNPSLVSTLMGCDVGKFSLRMSTPNGLFTAVTITSAPSNFPYSLLMI